MSYYLGIDVGGTNIKGMLADERLQPLARRQLPSLGEDGAEAVERQLRLLVQELLQHGGIAANELTGIGMGLPGDWDSELRLLRHCGNLPLAGVPFVQNLERLLGRAITIENDANAAALAEYHLGAGRGSSNMVFVTVSTGIGAGAVIGGKLYRGAGGSALELGHTTIDYRARPCSCGNRGCAEQYASGRAIGREASRLLGRTVTAEEVFGMAAAGDKEMLQVVDAAMEALGAALANVAALLAPEVLVLGGGVSEAGNIVLQSIAVQLRQRCHATVVEHMAVRKALLGSDAGVYGAMIAAMGDNYPHK